MFHVCEKEREKSKLEEKSIFMWVTGTFFRLRNAFLNFKDRYFMKLPRTLVE